MNTTPAPRTFPCNTDAQRAFLCFVREALILGARHEVFDSSDRLMMVLAIRAADIELCTAHALGVVVALLLKSEAEISSTQGIYWHTAGYLNLRNLGRAAGVIPYEVLS